MTTIPQGSFISIPFISSWHAHPIPNFTLSAAGLIVLADLSTIAQRTALRGGSSWLDSLLLVPGLHYQQAADELPRGEGFAVLTAVEISREGKPVAHRIVNQAVVNYVLRTAKEDRTVVLDVGEIPTRSRGRREKARARGQRAMLYGGGRPGGGREQDHHADGELTWAAHLLYLASPVLTCVAITFIVLLGDWWALALVLALMISRLLNIIVIKSRSRPKPTKLPYPFTQPSAAAAIPRITQYTITLHHHPPHSTVVVLRGLSTDLYALTTTVWLRPKTHVEGYLEATAKMLVYLVAAVSGNATQAGNLVMMALLLVSAGLLALSNARVTGLRNGGKVVAPSLGQILPGSGMAGGRGDVATVSGERHGEYVRDPPRREDTGETWPTTSEASSMTGCLEKGPVPVGRGLRRAFPSDDSVGYEVQLETRMGRVEISAIRDR